MISQGWLDMVLERVIPRIFMSSLFCGVIFSLILSSILDLLFPSVEPILTSPFFTLLALIVNWFVLFLLWNAGYFAYHYLKNYEREEVKNLRLESSKRDMELGLLRSQLNPHFIFNAMNTIRALVDEEPEIAKSAVTKLSNILRASLMAEKRNLISVKDELELVKDHLDLEQLRYEERLQVSYEVDPGTLSHKIPPMMIQTLAENAIKHGLSVLPDGGELMIIVKLTDGQLDIRVENSGQLGMSQRKGTGIGLDNIHRRLQLLFGPTARFRLYNSEENKVTAHILLPKSSAL